MCDWFVLQKEVSTQLFKLVNKLATNKTNPYLYYTGKPTPYVHWYRDNELIDDTYSFGTTNNTVHNDLLINKLSRTMFNSVLSCTASNNLTKAITVRVSLDINCELQMSYTFNTESDSQLKRVTILSFISINI